MIQKIDFIQAFALKMSYARETMQNQCYSCNMLCILLKLGYLTERLLKFNPRRTRPILTSRILVQ